MRFSALSLNFPLPLFFSKSYSSCLRLLPLHPVTFSLFFPSVTYLEGDFYKIMNVMFHIVHNTEEFLISNFRRVLNIVCILLGISPASDCCLPTFRNPLSVPSSRAGCIVLYIQPLKMELIEGSETSANNNRTPGKYPKEYIQYRRGFVEIRHGIVLKIFVLLFLV